MRSFVGLGLALTALLGTQCNLANIDALSAPPFEVIVDVSSDPGHPLSGAFLRKGGARGPSTGTDGTVMVKIAGREGESVDLAVECPTGYVSPAKPVTVLLRRNIGSRPAEYEARCPPELRHMVVAVRAENGGNLPVKVLDKVVGYTDPNGAFTYALPLHPGDGVELTLDTSGNKLLSPKNPTTLLTMKPYDDVLTVDQKFRVASPPQRRVTRRAHGPTRF